MCRRSQGRVTALHAEVRAQQSAGSPPAIDQSVAANVPSHAALRREKVREDLSISLPFPGPILGPFLVLSDFFWTPASIHHPLSRLNARGY